MTCRSLTFDGSREWASYTYDVLEAIADKATAERMEAARLAAVLPNPKERSASQPSASLRRRSGSILDGAATIERDGRVDCFQ